MNSLNSSMSHTVIALARYNIDDLYGQFGYQVLNSRAATQFTFADSILRQNRPSKEWLIEFGSDAFDTISDPLFSAFKQLAKKHGHIGNLDHLVSILFEEFIEDLTEISEKLDFLHVNQVALIPAILIAERQAHLWMDAQETDIKS